MDNLIRVHVDVGFNVDELSEVFFRFFFPTLVCLDCVVFVGCDVAECFQLYLVQEFHVASVLAFNALFLSLVEVADVLFFNEQGAVEFLPFAA